MLYMVWKVLERVLLSIDRQFSVFRVLIPVFRLLISESVERVFSTWWQVAIQVVHLLHRLSP